MTLTSLSFYLLVLALLVLYYLVPKRYPVHYALQYPL